MKAQIIIEIPENILSEYHEKDVVEIASALEKNGITVISTMADVITYNSWSVDDIKEKLSENGFKDNDSNVQKVLAELKTDRLYTFDIGFQVIEEQIEELEDQLELEEE